jgi:integrase
MPFNEWPQQQQEAWNRPEPAPVFKIQSLQRAEKSKGKPKIGVSLGPTVTDRNRRRSWGRFLFWQSMNATIGEKPTPESLERYVAHEECNGSSEISTTTYVWGIYYAARKIWPEHEWNWLLQDASGMKLIARPSRKKMEQFIPIGEICRLGFKLMDKAERMLPTRRAAILYRDGLLMVLLAFRPKRIANIRSLTIGESLLLNEDGIPYGLSFDRTKNGDASHTTLPRCLVHHVLRYLSVYRPLLLGHRSSRHLWISQHARPLHEGSYWCLVAKRTGEACGRKIGPHMIRTCFATSVAQERRELLPAVSKMLDHRDRRSIEPYQLLASSIAASRTLENKLEGLFKAHGSNYTS